MHAYLKKEGKAIVVRPCASAANRILKGGDKENDRSSSHKRCNFDLLSSLLALLALLALVLLVGGSLT